MNEMGSAIQDRLQGIMAGNRVRLPLESHLGLYSVFHDSLANRIIHMLFVPTVMVSGYYLIHCLSPALSNLVLLVLGISLAWIDLLGAAVTSAWLAVCCAAMVKLLPPSWPTAAVMVLVHLFAWGMLVELGHRFLESKVITRGGVQNSNYYFREGHFVGKNLGVDLHALDRFGQFNIGPLAVTFDFMWALGFFRPLGAAVAAVQVRARRRIEAGLSPFAPGGE